MEINYARVRDVKSPKRGDGLLNERSAGLDFFIPNDSAAIRYDIIHKNENNITLEENGFTIHPNCNVLIPSGIKMNLQSDVYGSGMLYGSNIGFAMIAFNKSGVAVKLKLDVGASVVDEDYQGEIHISLTNTSKEPIEVNFGNKIIQFLFIPVYLPNMVEKSEAELFNTETVRGSGGFGSTGIK